MTVGLGSNVLPADDGVEALVLRLEGELAAVSIDGSVLCGRWGSDERRLPPPRPRRRSRRARVRVRDPGHRRRRRPHERRCVRLGLGRDPRARARRRPPRGTGWRTADELGLSYRHSDLRPGHVVARVEYRLTPRPTDEIKAEVADLVARRKTTQPTNKRTFGSVFKNPPGELGAGRMIELCGLKGHRIGGAVISPRHANFIENVDGATSADCVALMAEARRRAHEEFGVELEREVVLLGPPSSR